MVARGLHRESTTLEIHFQHRSSRLAKLLLKRSGLTPLRVFMRPAPGDKRIIVDPFVDCPRIQELTLTCSKHTYTVLSDILVHLSQSLKYLNILGYTPYPNIEQQQPLRQPLFPDATAPPVVQALSLHATMLSTDRFPMLSHLQITGRYPDSSDLLTFLRGTPLLQTQHVHSGTSQSECPGARSQREPSRVRLDHLYALCLDLCGVPVRDISSLLRGLSIPPDATIQVHRIQLRNASDLHGLELPHL